MTDTYDIGVTVDFRGLRANTDILDAALVAVWAGYDRHGMDMRGHVHPHPDGTFYPDWNFRPPKEAKGVHSGFYCAAPLTKDGRCSDPAERTVEAFRSNWSPMATLATFVQNLLDRMVLGEWDGQGELDARVVMTKRGQGDLFPLLAVRLHKPDGTIKAYSMDRLDKEDE